MKDIKSFFHSRYSGGGLLVEADFSQLEVVGLAMLSGDKQLIADIRSGLDMHTVRAAELFDVPESAVSKSQRKIAKALSFQLQYGAGAKSMALKNGIDVKLAQKFIDNYYARYSRVREWQEEVATAVRLSRKPSERRTASGLPAGEGTYTSATGRIYKFYEYDAPDWSPPGTPPNFSPTEMKNYPIQGFATGDVMALFRKNVYRAWQSCYTNSEWCLINTVHDSVMLDVASSKLLQCDVAPILKDQAARLPKQLEEYWGIETHGLEFPITIKAGPNWADMEDFHA